MRKGITGLAAGFIAGAVLAGSAAFAIGIGSPDTTDRSSTVTPISREATRTLGIMNSASSVDATHAGPGHMTIAQGDQSARHEADRRAAAAHKAAERMAADNAASAPNHEATAESGPHGDTGGGTVRAPTPKQTEASHSEQMGKGGDDLVSNHDGMGHE